MPNFGSLLFPALPDQFKLALNAETPDKELVGDHSPPMLSLVVRGPLERV